MQAEPLKSGEYIGDVRQGGSCNAEMLHWAPHCHGTHTECIGHILPERVNVLDSIDTSPVLARLVTCGDDPACITLAALKQQLSEENIDHGALIIRTLPNHPTKQHRDYAAQPDFPVLDKDAVEWLTSLPLKHLLVDTPSLDNPRDASLSNHRLWWGENDSGAIHGFEARRRSITEMIYVADEIPDGEYWLHLELSPLVSDATPSRPVIFPVEAAG